LLKRTQVRQIPELLTTAVSRKRIFKNTASIWRGITVHESDFSLKLLWVYNTQL
jgi:hypothetical protein